MAAPHIAPQHKVVVIVVMVMLLAAWSIAAMNSTSTADADGAHQLDIDVPTSALDKPATVQKVPPGIGDLDTEELLDGLGSEGIPTPALTAYRRAADLLDDADPGCHLTWTVLAAIGRVESNHGQINKSQLSVKGLATPAIFGPRLTGEDGTTKVADTDDGIIDHDEVVDRGVGPMQFVPATWKVVAVDADGDDRRNPQDMTDAATGVGIHLCSGAGDLADPQGLRTALLRFNHFTAYADLVTEVTQAYGNGTFSVKGAGPSPSPSAEPTAAADDEPDSGSTGSSGGYTSRPTTPAPTKAPPPAAPPAPAPAPQCNDVYRLLHLC